MSNKKISIAIDGPAGAGKSTIARYVAQNLGYIYVDTGALYRAVAVAIKENNLTADNEDEIRQLLKKIKVDLKFIDGEQKVLLDGEDVGEKLRSPEISMLASETSAMVFIREFLMSLQKDIAHHNNVVMDGRDIGTVILPDADVKIFLTATAQDRAKRRYTQLLESGVVVEFDELLEEIKTRDYNDSHREVSPLKQAEDAMLIDTTGNSLQESIDLLYNVILNKLK